MTNTIFFLLMSVLMLNFSFGSMTFFSIHRTFNNLYRGTLESSISFIDKDGNQCEPYFKQKELERNVEEYFSFTLPRFVKEYYVSYFYFDNETMAYCTSDYCYNVKISLKAHINSLFDYELAHIYSISKGSLYVE